MWALFLPSAVFTALPRESPKERWGQRASVGGARAGVRFSMCGDRQSDGHRSEETGVPSPLAPSDHTAGQSEGHANPHLSRHLMSETSYCERDKPD